MMSYIAVILGIFIPIVVIYRAVRREKKEPVMTFDEWYERNWAR